MIKPDQWQVGTPLIMTLRTLAMEMAFRYEISYRRCLFCGSQVVRQSDSLTPVRMTAAMFKRSVQFPW
jgi:hypothetical protein